MEHIDSLILAFLNGVITHEEFEELKAWITAKEEHREYARKTIELWFSASVVADNTPHDAQSAYERFSKSVQSKDIEAEQPQGVSSSFNKLLWVGAAMIAIILLPLIGYLTGRNNVHNQFSSVRIVVPKGSESQLISTKSIGRRPFCPTNSLARPSVPFSMKASEVVPPYDMMW